MREEQRRKVTQITRSHVHSGAHYGASRENRSAFGYWIPLALTVTAATVGLVAWIWSERGDEDSESEPEHYYANAPQAGPGRPGSNYGARDDMRGSGPPQGGFGGDAAAAAAAAGIGAAAGYAGMSGGPPPGPGPLGSGPPQQGSFAPGPPTQGGFQGPPPGPPMSRPPGGEASSYFRETDTRDINTMSSGPPPQEEQTFFGRMSNALGITNFTGGNTSGQNNYSGAGWASGALAAAGSMVGGAVNSVVGNNNDSFEERRETRNVSMSGTGEQRNHFSDQEKWSEEADKPERKDTMSPRKSQQSLGTAAAAGLGAAALGAMAARESRSGSMARDSFVDVRGSAVDQTSTRDTFAEQRSLSGTAAEFYSGAVEVPRRSSVTAIHRKTVAIVVSSLEKGDGSTDVDMHQSILARIPESLHADRTRVIVMIYAPDLNVHPLSAISRRASERRSQSVPSVRSRSTSSYQNINTPGANGTPLPTPGDFPQDPENSASADQGILAHVSPRPMDSQSNLSRQGSRTSISGDRRQSDLVEYLGGDEVAVANPVDEETTTLFKTLYNQANAIVDRDTSIIPFTRLDSCKHILRSIQPELLYIQESLCGTDGSLVSELQGWVRNVVVVIGDEGGFGGLVDSDEEDNVEKYRADSVEDSGKWWKRESVSGLGRGVSIVESLRVADDWRRRVNEEE